MPEELTPPVDPVDDADRVAAVSRLRDLVSSGELTFERFNDALDRVLSAEHHQELESAMSALPSIVRLTPASRRLTEPLVVHAGIGRLFLGRGWQLAEVTFVKTVTGRCVLDLTEATWDARVVDLHLETVTGDIEVIVPKGVAVQLATVKGRMRLDPLVPPLAGGPVLRISASASTATIRIRHPRHRHARWWRRKREDDA